MNIECVVSDAVRGRIVSMADRVFEKIRDEWDACKLKWFRPKARKRQIESRVFMRSIGEVYSMLLMNTEYDTISYEEIFEFLKAVHNFPDLVYSIPLKEKEVYELDLSGQCGDDPDEGGSFECDDAVSEEQLRECGQPSLCGEGS